MNNWIIKVGKVTYLHPHLVWVWPGNGLSYLTCHLLESISFYTGICREPSLKSGSNYFYWLYCVIMIFLWEKKDLKFKVKMVFLLGLKDHFKYYFPLQNCTRKLLEILSKNENFKWTKTNVWKKFWGKVLNVFFWNGIYGFPLLFSLVAWHFYKESLKIYQEPCPSFYV